MTKIVADPRLAFSATFTIDEHEALFLKLLADYGSVAVLEGLSTSCGNDFDKAEIVAGATSFIRGIGNDLPRVILRFNDAVAIFTTGASHE